MGVDLEDPAPTPRFALPADHPGFSDSAYRARRAAIAAVGADYRRGEPISDVAYTPEEDALWRLVSAELRAKHQRDACQEYLDAAERLALPRERVPQLQEVSTRLTELTGFRLEPVPGLVPTRDFYGSLADRCFLATQYVRHHSVPFYTPEPDIVHEVIGHANMLASPVFADLYQLAGEASRRATSAQALEFFSRVFWFTIEFGVAWEGSELRTYGAGLLSSFGELDAFRHAVIRPFELEQMGAQSYDITAYQPLLFAASSLTQVVDELSAFFSGYDDAAYAKWVQ
jgi:phenylalanine-4-hydroxylase